jgi:hypothetical protein
VKISLWNIHHAGRLREYILATGSDAVHLSVIRKATATFGFFATQDATTADQYSN